MDLTTQPMWDNSVRYLLVLMELQSRGGVHVAVTASPKLAWVKQREARGRPLRQGGTVRSRSWHVRSSAAFTPTTDSPRRSGLLLDVEADVEAGPVRSGRSWSRPPAWLRSLQGTGCPMVLPSTPPGIKREETPLPPGHSECPEELAGWGFRGARGRQRSSSGRQSRLGRSRRASEMGRTRMGSKWAG